MNIMSNKSSLFSNSLFVLKFAYKTNKKIFYCKIPQIIINIMNPFVPMIFIRLILNEITSTKDIYSTLFLVAAFAFVSFVISMLNIFLGYHTSRQMDITTRKMKNELGVAVMKIQYSDVEQPRIRDFIELAKDGSNFMNILDEISNLITSVITLAGLAAIIVTIQPIIFLFIALVVFFRFITDRRNRKLWEKWRPRYAPISRKTAYFFRIMQNREFGKEVRINNLQDWLYKKVNDHTGVYLKASLQHNIEIQRNSILSSFTTILQECAVYIILAYRVVFKGMTIGDFSMYMTSVNTFSDNISSIVGSILAIMQNGVFAKDFRYCIELSESQSENTKKTEKIDTSHVTIEFINVSFKYPNTEKMILKNISFKIQGNETIAIMGLNGAGKTTLIKLLCRFYKPTEGKILLNGINIDDFSYDDYINYIGAVFQDFKLFDFSIGENVCLSDEMYVTKVKECIQKCGLGDKLDSLQNGLDTNISKEFDPEGIEFSGGEGQKLAMARALYKNAPIIVLDEPTSALDPIAESEIYEKFNEITKDKMTIYISHRLSSCRFCDRIIVLNNGMIAEYGSHDELINKQGLYSQMWNMQAQYYVGSNE